MIEHIKLLSLLVQIMIGIWVTSYIAYLSRSIRMELLSTLLKYNLVLNFAFIAVLVAAYFRINLSQIPDGPGYVFFRNFIDMSITAGSVLLIHYMVMIILNFRELEPGSRYKKTVISLILFLSACYLARIIFPAAETLFSWLDPLRHFVFENLILIEPLLLILSLVWWPGSRSRALRKVNNAFSLLFLTRYFVVAFILLLPVLWEISELLKFMLGTAALLVINTIPFIWARYVFLPFNTTVSRHIESEIDLERVFTDHNITQREAEITRMLIEGKSNKEIESKLFISYSTVKNHIYNIYGKLGVNSRYELLQYFLRLRSINHS